MSNVVWKRWQFSWLACRRHCGPLEVQKTHKDVVEGLRWACFFSCVIYHARWGYRVARCCLVDALSSPPRLFPVHLALRHPPRIALARWLLVLATRLLATSSANPRILSSRSTSRSPGSLHGFLALSGPKRWECRHDRRLATGRSSTRTISWSVGV